MDYLAEIRVFHAQQVQPSIGEPDGCTEAEVAALERQVGFSLPLAYRQYLLWMGKDEFGIFIGSDFFIDSVLSNTEWLPELLAENKVQFSLPEHYLVFFGHQGYVSTWFALPSTDDNPIVWHFNEGFGEKDAAGVHMAKSPYSVGRFTDFVLETMRAMAKYLPGTADHHRTAREAALKREAANSASNSKTSQS